MQLLYQIFIDPFVQMGSAPDLFVQTLWEGLVAGVLYALIALGFVLIFKASGVFNFAQGIMVVFAALTLGRPLRPRRAGVSRAGDHHRRDVSAGDGASNASCCGPWSISRKLSCSWRPSG